MKNLNLKKTIVMLALGISGIANAGLVGDSVTTEILVGGSSFQTVTATVGSGNEGNFFGNQIFDYGDFSFNIRSVSTFCGMTCQGLLIELKLTDLDIGGLTGVTTSTTLIGVSTVFGSNFVTFSWIDQDLNPTTYLSADFSTGGTVPEPASLALVSLGLLGMAALRKRAQS